MYNATPNSNYDHNRGLINQSIKLLEDMKLPWITQGSGNNMNLRLPVSTENKEIIVGLLNSSGLVKGELGVEGDFIIMPNSTSGSVHDVRTESIVLMPSGIRALNSNGYQFLNNSVSSVHKIEVCDSQRVVGQGA